MVVHIEEGVKPKQATLLKNFNLCTIQGGVHESFLQLHSPGIALPLQAVLHTLSCVTKEVDFSTDDLPQYGKSGGNAKRAMASRNKGAK